MQRLSIHFAVMQAIVLGFALSWTGQLTAEPLSAEVLQQPARQERIPELVDAREKLNKGNVEGALADMKAAAEKNPHLPPAEVMMAKVYAGTNRPGAVRYWVERAVVETPNDPEAYVILGQDALKNKRMAEARLLFEKAHQMLASFEGDAKRKESLQALASRQLAGLAMGRKDWDTAKGYLDESLKLRPDDNVMLQLLARVFFEQDNTKEALDKLKAARMAEQNVLTPEAIVAQWFEEAGDRENAMKYMGAALKAADRDFRTRFVAANWAFKAQSFKEARRQADFALQLAKKQGLDPSNALILAGSIAIFQGDYPAAEEYLQKAVALAPANFAASNNLALALCEQDDEAKQKLAFQYARINARLYPKEIEALSTLGRVLFRLEDYKEADKAFRKVASSGRLLSPDTVYYVAALYAHTDRKADAKKWLSEAVKKKGLFSQRKNAEQLLKQLGP